MNPRVSRVLLGGFAAAAALAVPSTALAQSAASRPFPTSANYAQGFAPSAVTAAKVQSSYNNWKATFLKSDCGSGYNRVDNGSNDGSTFSEGQGYGMVLTAYFGDKAAFDGLWAFAKKSYGTSNLMGWHVTCSGFVSNGGGQNSASDGDEDIGFALIVASVQWGGTYAADAKTYLANLKNIDFTTCSATGRVVVTAGSWQTSAACMTSGGGSNTSYWMPAYYRVFETFTGDSFWGKAANDIVTLYGLAANGTTGLMVNEVDQNGAPVSGQTYDYNSCRIPWRAALDYLWYGTPAVQSELTKLTTWANGVGINNIVDGYNANGTTTGTNKGLNAFVGGFAVGAMADSQALANSFGTYFAGIADGNGGYYGSSLRTLYLLAASGYQWNPVEAVDGGSAAGSSDSGTAGGSSSSGGTGTSSGGGGSSGGAGSSGGDAGSGAASGGLQTMGGGGSSQDGGAHNGASGSGGGCACRMAASPAGGAGATLLALLGGAFAMGRRRKRDER
jgi:MYXO-CTERM domain-containing protein